MTAILMDLPFDWTTIAVNLPGYAIIIWLVYHKTSVADPAKDQAHAVQLDKAWVEVARQRADYEAHMQGIQSTYVTAEKESRADFMLALAQQRQDFRDSIKAMSDALTRLTDTTLSHVNEARTVWQKQAATQPKP